MKTTKKIFAAVLAVMMIALMIPFSASAATVELNVTCDPNSVATTEADKTNYIGTYVYEFYKLAKVDTGNGTVTVVDAYKDNAALVNAIKEATNNTTLDDKATNSKAQHIIAACESGDITWNSTDAALTLTFRYDGSNNVPTQQITSLDDGIYYVYCAQKPGTVKAVSGSLISLPYYNGTNWTYKYNTVNLASKINVSGITVTKTVADSNVGTQKNADYTLTASTAGSTTNKVGTYAIVDNMDNALSLIDSTVKVYFVKDGAETPAEDGDFTVVSNYPYKDATGNDATATFAVVASDALLQNDKFYGYDTIKVTFSAKVNADIATKVLSDLPNTDGLYYGNEGNLTYKTGQTVNVATAGLDVTKVDGNTTSTKIADAEFTLYSDAACNTPVTVDGVIVKATTTTNGNDKFCYGSNEFYFTPGVTYYVKETKAPANYNINSTIFEVTAVAKAYTPVGTVENGATVVKDYPVTVPSTGGMGTMMFYVGGAALIACAGVLLFVLKRKKAAK
ncbi:MAG: SpaH/EbpB family LPXTG-anchored major pilin [Ruminococcus bromii]|nr:SpaH/EbpB family LPXTG-anchored major pilin [Ruminococcus bromii]MDY4977733.1 SpaH/EbpB family LPXTG-anchored major pilin [Ruminococcus bromii]